MSGTSFFSNHLCSKRHFCSITLLNPKTVFLLRLIIFTFPVEGNIDKSHVISMAALPYSMPALEKGIIGWTFSHRCIRFCSNVITTCFSSLRSWIASLPYPMPALEKGIIPYVELSLRCIRFCSIVIHDLFLQSSNLEIYIIKKWRRTVSSNLQYSSTNPAWINTLSNFHVIGYLYQWNFVDLTCPVFDCEWNVLR